MCEGLYNKANGKNRALTVSSMLQQPSMESGSKAVSVSLSDLKAAMAKVLARVDGGSAHRVGVFKARAPPLTTAVVASILHKVDNDLRKIPEDQELPSVGTGPFEIGRKNMNPNTPKSRLLSPSCKCRTKEHTRSS